MRPFHYTFVLLLVALLASSCAYNMKKSMVLRPQSPEVAMAAPVQMDEAKASRAAPHTAVDLAKMADTPGGAEKGQPAKKKKNADRKVIYTASLCLKVVNKAAAREAINKLIQKYDGIIANSTLDEINFRVPPESFDQTLTELAELGEITRREVHSEDVTAQYVDLGLRLDVAEASRQRLKELLNKSGAVKDVLEVEHDIRRLTEEIETMKGQMRVLQDQIELATIRVQLEEKVLQALPARHRDSPLFAWIDQLGLDRLLAAVPADAPLDGEHTWASYFHGPRFRLGVAEPELLPAGFVPLRYTGEELLGATPEDFRLRVRVFTPRQRGTLDFWLGALEDEFKNYRDYTIGKRPVPPAMPAGLTIAGLRCQTALASEPWLYDIWLVQSAEKPRELYVIEYGRTVKKGDRTLKAVESAVAGLKVRR